MKNYSTKKMTVEFNILTEISNLLILMVNLINCQVFVADGYCNNRIMKFNALGHLLRIIPQPPEGS